MPASSRKRNKGRDRKAKKEEAERVKMHNMWQVWARGNMSGAVTIQCNHGFGEVVIADESHPVSSFITTFCMTSLHDAFLKCPEMKNDDSLRKMVTDILIRIGANLLYAGTKRITKEGPNMDMTIQFIINTVLAITILENYDEELDYTSNSINPIVSVKNRDLQCGGIATKYMSLDSTIAIPRVNRDLLKFFRKRITCSCLKKAHLEARKTQPKMGACGVCNEMKERSLLMVCSTCMLDQYCSKDCQIAASPGHWEACDNYVKTHRQPTTISNDAS